MRPKTPITEADRDAFQRYGDVNRDGVIDLDDIMELGVAYGSRVGEPKYSYACDLNGDGIIDLDDYMTVVGRFGWTIDDFVAKTRPPLTYIYTLRITLLKLSWFNKSAFEGIVGSTIVPAVIPIIGALGYTHLKTYYEYKNSTVDVNMQFSGAGSPPIPLVAIVAAIAGILIGIGLIVIGIAWYKQAEVQEKHEVTKQEVVSSLDEALAKGLITSEQYTEIMSKLEAGAGIDWQSLLIIGLVGFGAIVVLPKLLPKKEAKEAEG